jgi:hypothetical protein
VVRNPAWLTPYVSCALVGLGLVTQFLMHLAGFIRKRLQKSKPAQQLPRGVKLPARKSRPALAAPGAEALAAGVRRTAERRNS